MQTYSDPKRANDPVSLPDAEQHDTITIEDENMTLRLALNRLLDAYTADVQRCPSMTVAISYATNTDAINRAKQALQGQSASWRYKMSNVEGMTNEKWSRMSQQERDAARGGEEMTAIWPGDLVTLKSELLKEGESFKMGRSTLKAGDILRCIGTDGSIRVFVSKRTGTSYAFEMRALAAKFNAVGFDGLESIDAPAPTLKQVVLGGLYPEEMLR